MTTAKILPMCEYDNSDQDDEKYDEYISGLYEDSFSLANTFEMRKNDPVGGQFFSGKEPRYKLRLAISHDYTKLNVQRNGSSYMSKEVSMIKYICEGVHEKYAEFPSLSCVPNRIIN